MAKILLNYPGGLISTKDYSRLGYESFLYEYQQAQISNLPVTTEYQEESFSNPPTTFEYQEVSFSNSPTTFEYQEASFDNSPA